MTHHLINIAVMHKTNAYKEVAARFCISDRLRKSKLNGQH